MTKGTGWDHTHRVAQMPPPTGQQCPCTGCARHTGRCTTAMWPGNTDADHIIARFHGGQHGPLRWMCKTCNRSRGATLGNKARALRKAAVTAFHRPVW